MIKDKHHLFNYYQIRRALVKIFGEPKNTREHKFIHKEIRKAQKKLPRYEIDREKHDEIHAQERAGFKDGYS